MDLDVTVNDFINAIIENKSDEISDCSEKMLIKFMDAIKDNCIESFWNSLKEKEDRLEGLINYLGINEDGEKEKIYYFSTLVTLTELSKQLNIDSIEKEEFNSYRNYKYIYPILFELAKCNFLTHKELCSKLDISTNTLSNFNRRTKDFNLWTKKTIGKSSSYVITAKGKNALRMFTKDTIVQNDNNLEKYTVTLLDCILKEMGKSSPTENGVIHNINKHYNNGISCLQSDLVKSRIKNILFIKQLNTIKDTVKDKFCVVQEFPSQYNFQGGYQFCDQYTLNNLFSKEEIAYDRI